MKIINVSIILLILTMFTQNAAAGHLMGGEIFYKWLGGKKYEVTARVYRECRGNPFNSPDIFVSDYSGNNPTRLPITYSRISIQDVTPLCKSTLSSPCNPANSYGSLEGYELHTFVGTIDFDSSPYDAFIKKGACKVYFDIGQCCRNLSITTLSPNGYPSFYLDAMLDICNSGFVNSSPQLKSISNNIAYCNVPMYQNYGGNDFIDYDSLAFELVTPLDAYNTPETYTFSSGFSAKLPMTPYCTAPKTISCSPDVNKVPPRGFYFDPLNGDIIFTPVNCTEIGVIAVKISEFRRDPNNKNKWLLMGYAKRESTIVVRTASYANDPPTTSDLGKTYKFKTRQNTCINISSKDINDTTFMSVELPPGATFRYLDSNAKNKTGILCWKVHDSVYNKVTNANKKIPLFLTLKDNYCNWRGISIQGFYAQLLRPDSSGLLNVNSFNDINKNKNKDIQDSSLPITFRLKANNFSFYAETNQKGFYEDSIVIGMNNIATAQHPYYKIIQKDTNLLVKFFNKHIVNIGVKRSAGIYGRIYEDKNANCKYDEGETFFPGHKVYTDSNKYVGVSDKYGVYYIKAPKGTYTLTCDLWDKQYKISCPKNNSISISINDTDFYLNNDFSIYKNKSFEDLSVIISTGFLRKGGTGSVQFTCSNNGYSIRKNIQLKCSVDGNKFVLKSGNYNFASLPIGSLLPGEKRTIYGTFPINKDSFNVSDRICFRAFLDSTSSAQDSLQYNNSSYSCGVVVAPNDPNEKNVDADSFRSTMDSTINYTIHFQNTGADTALRILVKDTIDTHYLSMDKFRLNWSDYPCETIISDNVVTFIFDNINLPPVAKGDNNSAGFNFTLGLKSKVAIETSFKNKSAIYFDFKNPVFTKDAIATIISPLSLNDLKTSGTCKNESNSIHYKSLIKLNAGNQLNLEISGDSTFSSPTTLKTLTTTTIEDNIEFLLPSSYKSNIYYLRLKSSNPAAISIPKSGIIKFKLLSTPSYSVNSNLVNNAACESDTLKINFTNNVLLYKVVRNGISLNNFNNTLSYNWLLKPNEVFQVIALDSSTGCKDTIEVLPTIYKKPAITISVSNRKKEYCKDEIITLKASGGIKYSYFKDSTIIKNKTIDSIFNTMLDVSSIYRISGEDAHCINISDTLHIIVNPLPVAGISILPNPICEKDTANITLSGGVKYDLLKNGIVVLSNTTINLYKTNNNDKNKDMFYSEVYSNKGCMKQSDTIMLNVNQIPTQPLIIINNNDLSVAFTGSIKWYRNNILLTNTASTFTNAPSGVYRVIVTNIEGCSSTSNSVIHNNTAIKESVISNINIYPNPANDELNIENTSNHNFKAELYNLSGQSVLRADFNEFHSTLSVEHLSPGLYLLRITDSNGETGIVKINIVR